MKRTRYENKMYKRKIHESRYRQNGGIISPARTGHQRAVAAARSNRKCRITGHADKLARCVTTIITKQPTPRRRSTRRRASPHEKARVAAGRRLPATAASPLSASRRRAAAQPSTTSATFSIITAASFNARQRRIAVVHHECSIR